MTVPATRDAIAVAAARTFADLERAIDALPESARTAPSPEPAATATSATS
ncbi:hypothetical protein [Agromyces bauzanensis]